MDEHEVRPRALQARDRLLAAVDGAVVDDPEQNTRCADAYGSLFITSATSASRASLLIFGSQRPNSPRAGSGTSIAAMYASVPHRRYSCSTSPGRPAPGATRGWRRSSACSWVFSSALTT